MHIHTFTHTRTLEMKKISTRAHIYFPEQIYSELYIVCHLQYYVSKKWFITHTSPLVKPICISHADVNAFINMLKCESSEHKICMFLCFIFHNGCLWCRLLFLFCVSICCNYILQTWLSNCFLRIHLKERGPKQKWKCEFLKTSFKFTSNKFVEWGYR